MSPELFVICTFICSRFPLSLEWSPRPPGPFLKHLWFLTTCSLILLLLSNFMMPTSSWTLSYFESWSMAHSSLPVLTSRSLHPAYVSLCNSGASPLPPAQQGVFLSTTQMISEASQGSAYSRFSIHNCKEEIYKGICNTQKLQYYLCFVNSFSFFSWGIM